MPSNQNILSMQARTISLERGKRGEDVLDRLRNMAIFYEFKPGEKLNEAELAELLGVSRTQIGRAHV